MNEFDYDKLRKDLTDYFGTAMPLFPAALMDVAKLETSTNEELVIIAEKNGLDLRKYNY